MNKKFVLAFLIGAAVLQAPSIASPKEKGATAVTKVPGARPGDKEMSCEDIAKERTAIAADVSARTAAGQASAKRKKVGFGLLKGLASVVAPSVGAGIGGLGGQLASSAANQALSQVPSGAAPAPAQQAALPTPEQADRLARLDSIDAYRQCTAS